MSAAYPLVSHTRAAFSLPLERVAGVAGLTFVALVAATNVAIGALDPPSGNANAGEVVAFFEDHGTALMAVRAMMPISFVALILFLGGAFPRLSSASPAAAFWTRVGAIGIVMVGVLFLTHTLVELPLLTNIEGLAGEPAVVESLWLLHGASLIFSGLGLTVTLLGLSRAARLSGLIPAWQEAMGLLAAFGFFVAAMAAAAALDGSPIGLLGLVAFLAWLAWLAMTSIRLLRSNGDAA